MKATARRLWIRVSAAMLVLPASSCALFAYRHKQWEKKVHRTPEGVLHAFTPFELIRGDTGLLLVHGFGDGPHVWASLAPELAERGATVRAIRLPGWGEPLSAKQTVSVADWENTIVAETLAMRSHCRRVIILAHSLGGCLSTVLAQSGRLPADALILYAPMFQVSNVRSPLLPTHVWHNIGKALLPPSTVIECLFPEHVRCGQVRPRTHGDPFVPARLYQLLYDEMDVFNNQNAELPIPLRLVLPGKDLVLNSARARAWFETLHAPAKTLYVDEASGHVLPLDLDVSAEADRIYQWLNEIGI